MAENGRQSRGDVLGRLGREERLERKRPQESVGVCRYFHRVLQTRVWTARNEEVSTRNIVRGRVRPVTEAKKRVLSVPFQARIRGLVCCVSLDDDAPWQHGRGKGNGRMYFETSSFALPSAQATDVQASRQQRLENGMRNHQINTQRVHAHDQKFY